MKFEEIHATVGHVPYISRENAKFLYDLILEKKITNILELGIAHGTATCYMAAALQELGRGSITAVDLIETKDAFSPSAEEQLETAGLEQFGAVVRMQTGYTWFLHDEIAKNTHNDICEPVYDLCIIDGPKNWTIDGAAFFFVDKLIRKDGWIIFDDYSWNYAFAMKSKDKEATDGITHRSLSKIEQDVPHIKEVFELLVKQHPDYSNLVLMEDMDWAMAQKTKSANKQYSVVYQETGSLVSKFAFKLYQRFQSNRA